MAVALLVSGLALTVGGCDQEGATIDEGRGTAAPLSRTSLAERFPAVAEMLAPAESSPWTAQQDGYRVELGARRSDLQTARFQSLARQLVVTLPARAEGVLTLTTERGDAVVVQRRGAEPARCLLEDDTLLLCEGSGAGYDVAAFARGPILEELWLVHGPIERLGYDVTLPPGWRLMGVAGDPAVVELRDGGGTAQLRVAAPGAWDATGDPVQIALEVDDDGVVMVMGEAEAWPVLIDPSWVDAGVPLKLRIDHSATLLLDGRVLIAGGGTTEGIDGSAEVYDPATGTSTAVSPLLEARAGHTATLLPDGRVLLAGGLGESLPLASTELFDPGTGIFTAGPALSSPRAGHSATRLLSGRVLIAAGGMVSAEQFDPTTDSFVPTAPMTVIMADRVAAARLLDGRVLLVGAVVPQFSAQAQIFDPAANGGTGAFVPTGAPTTFSPFSHSLTVLRDGRVLALGGCPCGSAGTGLDSSHAAELFDPAANFGVGAFVPTGSTVRSRLDHSATLLPSGEVLITGSYNDASGTDPVTAEVFDPAGGTFSAVAEPMAMPHGRHTATLLPSGDVFVFGGNQAVAEIFVGGGTTGPGAWTTVGAMGAGRQRHSATTLADGRVLVAGGEGSSSTDLDSAEIYDPTGDSFAPTGSLASARSWHTATLLLDDRVLLAGGWQSGSLLTSGELFDPSGNGGVGAWSTTGSMATARMRHTATLLPSGEVLVAGGGLNASPTDTAERYDPVAGTFTATASPMTVPRFGHGAALLPNGKVLVVGLNSAELYDPVTDSFTATGSPGTVYTPASVVVLANGKALVTGSSTLAAELYDPETESFAFVGIEWVGRTNHEAVGLATGGALLLGGQDFGSPASVHADGALFLPLSSSFAPIPVMADPRSEARAVLLHSGEVLITGGVAGVPPIAMPPQASAERWSPTVGDLAWRPTITSVAATVTPGDEVVIQGSGLSGPEASNGRSSASTSNHPIVIWQSRLGGGALYGQLVSWTSSTVTWRVPPTAAYGPGQLTLVVNGIQSPSRPVAIEATGQGVGCRYDGQCATGFCADGVCCDQPCTQLCEACLATLKGSGDDGTCGPVPPELDPDDDCVLPRGTPCTSDEQCDTAHCVDDVCCETTCPGQCEACDVKTSVGLCVPVVGAPHGDRPVCDPTPPDDPCDLTSCDGVEREQCAGTVGPCGAYGCTPDGCLEACEDDEDCAPGHHCEDGVCEAGQCDGTIATTPDGTEVDCAPYLCRADGTCPNSCSNVDDCADPFACSVDGRCVPRPPVDDGSAGCGCQLPGKDRSRTGPIALVVALVLGAGWRRRTPRGAAARRWVALAFGGAVLLSWLPAWSQPAPPASPAATTDPEAGPAPTEPVAEDGTADPVPAPEPPATEEPAESSEGMTLQERKQKARAHFERGLALGEEGAWSAALAEFNVSRGVYPTRVATKNAALGYRKLERFDEALETYESLLRDFDNLKDAERELFAKQIIDLRALVGTIEIDGAKTGATILIDGRARAVHPATDPLRVPAGTHVVRVHLDGYEPFETQLEVAGRSSVRVPVKLTKLNTSGILKVIETSGKALDVVVDGVVVGQSPWEGRVSVGRHVVRLEGDDELGTSPVPAPVAAGETANLRLEAKPLDATLRIAPTPASAEVAIDSVSVGRGVWEGRLPSGKHRIEVTEDGFIKSVKDVNLKAKASDDLKVRLERDEDAERWQLPSKFTFDLTGAVAVAPTFGGDVSSSCSDDCSQGPGLGVLTFLHAGYELGSGLGFGVAAGYLQATQEVEGRATPIHPVGLPPRQGSTTDTLRLRGLAVGATGSFLMGEQYPLLFRLGVGPLFATVEDRRVGSFPVDGMSYQAGPVTQEPSATYLYIDPEVRLSLPVGDHFHIGASLQVLVLVGLSEPKWDESEPLDAATDGIGLYGGEALTGRVMVFVSPGIGARAHF